MNVIEIRRYDQKASWCPIAQDRCLSFQLVIASILYVCGTLTVRNKSIAKGILARKYLTSNCILRRLTCMRRLSITVN